MKRKVYLAALAVISAATIGGAYAARSGDNDALAIASAKLDLTQAVSAAERHVGGKAARAFYWLAILFTFALGTAAGDLAAEGLRLGYMPIRRCCSAP